MPDQAYHVLRDNLLNRFDQYKSGIGDYGLIKDLLDPRREDAIFTLREVCRYLAAKGHPLLEWEIECAERTLKGWERSSQETPRTRLPLTNDCGVWRMTSSDTKKQPSEILESLAPVIAGVLGAYLSRQPAPSDTDLDTFDGLYEAIDEARKRNDKEIIEALTQRLLKLIEAREYCPYPPGVVNLTTASEEELNKWALMKRRTQSTPPAPTSPTPSEAR